MDNQTPKNLQELLRFAVKLQQNKENEYIQIDEDKKVFLENVLQSISGNNVETILNAIRVLQDELSSDEKKVDALDLIRDHIDINFGSSFINLDGADILIKCTKHSNKTVCISAINIVAEMSQNNPVCQQYFLKKDVIEQLVKYLRHEESELVASSLYALSALIRNCEPALMEFLKYEGLMNVSKCLRSESPRIFAKACFLLVAISSEFALVKDECAKVGVFSEVIKRLRVVNGYEADIEMTLHAMSLLLESRYCNPSEDKIKYIADTLKTIIIKNRNLPECAEIVCYSNSILRNLKSRRETEMDYAD